MKIKLKNSLIETITCTKITQKNFKDDLECLFLMGFLEKLNKYERRASSFAPPKSKIYRVQFLSDLLNLDRQLKYYPYPMTKIRDMLLNLEDFKYDTPLN